MYNATNTKEKYYNRGKKMWIDYLVLLSIIAMVLSIMVVLIVETVHTTKSISRKRSNNTIK